MITSIDTNILIDIFLPDPVHGERSLQLLEDSYAQGSLVICNVVYAELVPQFPDRALLDSSLKKIGIEIILINNESAFLAGQLWNIYRKKTKSRDRIITDFLIGAFTKTQAEQFLTRDRGFYKQYFTGLHIL
jgi:predicted nucleic acid-binding protein